MATLGESGIKAMIIIGLSGSMRCGKDTVWEFISEASGGRARRIAFADPLKKEVALACGCTVPFINQHKSNFRLILQGWGSDFRRELCGKQYWVNQLQQELDGCMRDGVSCVVITDARYSNEYDLVKRNGGTVWRIHRPKTLLQWVKSLFTWKHSSEALDFPYDRLILNNSTLETLRERAIEALYEETQKAVRSC